MPMATALKSFVRISPVRLLSTMGRERKIERPMTVEKRSASAKPSMRRRHNTCYI